MGSRRSRDRIFARLNASGTGTAPAPKGPVPAEPDLDRGGRLTRLTERMAAIRTEVHVVDADGWVHRLRELAEARGWRRLLYGPASPVGAELAERWTEGGIPPEATLVPYTEPVETCKEELFAVDAGVTGTRGGVADTGAVVLWPTEDEPRLLSLVPPVHVAVLDADRMYNSLSEMMAAERWAEGMPTNALLISGPSKTADIEFTLVFGVHGPKELVLLVRK